MVSGLPMLARYLGGVALARLSDHLIRTRRISRLTARKLFNSLSQVRKSRLLQSGSRDTEMVLAQRWTVN